MRFLFAPDSFKGTLSSQKIIQTLSTVAQTHFPGCTCIGVPMADGGDGTLDVLLYAQNARKIHCTVRGPLGTPVEATYAVLANGAVFIEMAQASGITRISSQQRDPMLATSYGTGQLIADALDRGYRTIYIGIGGSATNDGGLGAMSALGIAFYDQDGIELQGRGRDLSRVNRIVADALHPGVAEAEIQVLCDVTNPLTGPTGATAVYGPQKGVTPELLPVLEEGMRHYASIVRQQLDIEPDRIPGAGAAGGMGSALLVYLGARLVPGIEAMMDLVGFDGLLDGVDLVITGEGNLDRQSVFGKVPVGVATRATKQNIPVVAVAGGLGEGAEAVYDAHISGLMAVSPRPMTLEEACDRADVLLEQAADRLFRLLKIGTMISN